MVKLKKLDKAIEALQKESDQLSSEFQEYAEVNYGFEVKFKNCLNRLGTAVMNREPDLAVEAIEKERAELKTEFDRFCAKGPAIDRKILELELDLKQKKGLRSQILGQLAAIWLSEEVKIYDAAASTAILCIRRLLVGHRLLMDGGQQDLYRQTIGEAFRYLPGAKIPVIKGFNSTEYTTGSPFHAGRKLYDEVVSQIEREEV